MQWVDSIEARYRTVAFSLRDLRVSKGISQKQLAEVLKISKSMYHSIECGHRKPNIDVVYMLALVYQTSMDFIYHAFYRQHYIWHFPDDDLQYSMRQAKSIDIQYLRDRQEPESPPKLPLAIVWEKDDKKAAFRPYGLSVVNIAGEQDEL